MLISLVSALTYQLAAASSSLLVFKRNLQRLLPAVKNQFAIKARCRSLLLLVQTNWLSACAQEAGEQRTPGRCDVTFFSRCRGSLLVPSVAIFVLVL